MKLTKLLFITTTILATAIPSNAFDGTFYLVRHAEKQLNESNPPLTKTGFKRAKKIAAKLADKNLKAIYSTDYIRTMQTAAPAAKMHGLAIMKYDPRKLQKFAEKLRKLDGTYLIVGHSNTTPQLASFLSGTEAPQLTEQQYDHVYIVTINDQGEASLKIEYTEPRTE